MKLLPTEAIQINYEKIKEIDFMVKSIYRLIIFSRYHEDDDLLDSFFNGMHELTELVSIKNAQMEAQNEDEAKFKSIWIKNTLIARSLSFDASSFQIRKNEIPKRIYNVVHTGPKTQLGGLKKGLFNEAYQIGTA